MTPFLHSDDTAHFRFPQMPRNAVLKISFKSFPFSIPKYDFTGYHTYISVVSSITDEE
jgi:hypothetical protein